MLDYDSAYANQAAFCLIQPPTLMINCPHLLIVSRDWIVDLWDRVSLYGPSVHKMGLKVSYTVAVFRTNVLLL